MRKALFSRCVGSLMGLALLVMPGGSLCATEVVQNATKDGRTLIGDQPWTPSESSTEVRPRVIYGPDDRRDVYQVSDPQQLALAASTCGLTDASDVTNNGNGTYTLATSAYTVGGEPACAGEPYGAQPLAMWCTGFMVGYDLIATAGHCYNTGDISGTRFVFGYKMTGPSSPVTVVSAAQVYTGVAIVGRQLVGDLDYAIVRVDRKIVAPGAVPLSLRRAGVIANNTTVGVIGHPSGLPLKIAFGGTTRVFDNTNDGFFVANLDTYGGNSGSPVFNAASGVLEGILVRGQTDFVDTGSCFVSNIVADSPGNEEVSKSNTFMKFVPGASFDRVRYRPQISAGFHAVDDNLAGSTLSVTITTTSGDSESRNATDPDNDNTYNGTISLSSVAAPIVPGNGIVEVRCNDTLTLTYSDANAGASTPAVFTSQATMDCAAPTISNLALSTVLPEGIEVMFNTDEPATATLQAGLSCGAFNSTANQGLDVDFSAQLGGLQPCTNYFYRVVVQDEAGNMAVADNGGNCFATTTLGEQAVLTDTFNPVLAGWSHSSAAGADNWQVRSSPRAVSPSAVYSYSPGANDVDASLVSPALPAGDSLSFYHTHEFEDGDWDGGRLEYRTSPAGAWTDMGSRVVFGGYTGVIAAGVLGGEAGWTEGTLGAMTKVVVDFSGLPANTQVRFRFSSDSSVLSAGWEIDNLKVAQYFSCVTGVSDWAMFE